MYKDLFAVCLVENCSVICVNERLRCDATVKCVLPFTFVALTNFGHLRREESLENTKRVHSRNETKVLPLVTTKSIQSCLLYTGVLTHFIGDGAKSTNLCSCLLVFA